MIRAIFFDLDNTLIDRDLAHREYCTDFVASYAGQLDRTRRDLLLEQMVHLDRSGYCNREVYFRMLAEEFPELEINPVKLWRTYGDSVASSVRPDPAVCKLLAELAGGFHLAVVTNGTSRGQRLKIENAKLGPFFTHVFVSSEVGVKKPHPAIFRRAARSVGVPCEEVLFVGDDVERDVCGSRSVGMRTCWVSRGRQYPLGNPEPDSRIPRLECFKDALAVVLQS